jgi:hypothetical protein
VFVAGRTKQHERWHEPVRGGCFAFGNKHYR